VIRVLRARQLGSRALREADPHRLKVRSTFNR
jgi:hypothetical protein